ncbi:WD40-repeat-containing domain protein [Naematelia encephala]|uniref:WD40-repeat-containing domain protein n=1 Tax=Naematelia encephala TaxID=71784 RepID=A0A1Y2B1K6_9TREE|nr:WD40-repeat-containing domain protein [Naematelia encephala]
MNGTSNRKALKSSFRASPRSLRPLYTGGPVLLTKDGAWLITTVGEEVLITEVRTGLGVGRIRGDSTNVTSLSLSYHTTPPTLITCHLSTTIRFYPLPDSLPLTTEAPLLSYSRQLTKAHSAPILVSAVSPDNTLLATGSSDGSVKVWDLEGGYVTHLYRGHGGPVSALRFSFPVIPGEERVQMDLFTGSTDSRVRVFDLRDASARAVGGGGAAKPRAVLEGHVSVIRGIDVSVDGRWAVTGARDKVVLVWDLQGESSGKKGKGKGKEGPKIVQTIIAQEQVETVGLLPLGSTFEKSSRDRLLCFTGGDKGSVRIWDVLKGEAIGSMAGVEGVDETEVDEDEQRGITTAIYDSTSDSLLSVHADQNIIYHSLATSLPTRQIVGFNDEIIDVVFLSHPSSSSSSSSSTSPHSHLALATNSSLIRIYSTSSFDARLLSGHKDTVLCLDRSPDYEWLVSGSKDKTARVWAPTGRGEWTCIAICEGHAEAVGAVALSRKGKQRFLFTASQDRTIKMWDLTGLPESVSSTTTTPSKPKSLATIRAHEKDINSLDLSPNDKFLASGSQDKTVKLFSVDFDESAAGGASGAIKLAGTCNGHRRGVWTVKFSKVDKVVATGAADRTVKLWSLDDFTCLKTFEGHTNSVLRVDFLSMGQQLVTSSSDGLVKLWNIRDEQCIKTLDNHEDKIWALAVSADEKTIVSAGADSIATFWEDSTEVEQAETNEALIQAVKSEQDFTNYLALKDYRRAILLALAMSQPGRLLNLFSTVLATATPGTYTGSPEVDQIIATLSGTDLVRLLKHVRSWNTNARTSGVAQAILHAVLQLKTPDQIFAAYESAARISIPTTEEEEVVDVELQGQGQGQGEDNKKPKPKRKEEKMGMRELLDGLIPYSERHYQRIEKLVQESYVLDYVVGEMDGGVFGAEIMDIDMDGH